MPNQTDAAQEEHEERNDLELLAAESAGQVRDRDRRRRLI